MAICAPNFPIRPMAGGLIRAWPEHVWVKASGRYIADTYGVWYLIPDYIPDEWVDRLALEVEPDTGRCHWLWTGWNNGEGHGKHREGGETKYTHRTIYEKVHGVKLGRWQYVDHLAGICGRKACMVVQHLEAVRPGVNTARGPGAQHQFKTTTEYLQEIRRDYGEPLDALG